MTDTPRLPIETVRRYAYWNLFASFLIWGFALAAPSMMMPVMYKTIMAQMHWTNPETTLFRTVNSGVAGIAGLLVGRMFLKYGLKRMFTLAVVVIGLATAGLYFADTLWVYYLCAGISGFASMICAVSYQVTLARWFSGSLGRMVGIALLGGAVSGLIVPIAVKALVSGIGWHGTAAVIGLAVAVLLTLVVVFCVRETPEDYGYTAAELDPAKVVPGAQAPKVKPGEDFSEVVKSIRLWLVLAAVFASGLFSNAINEHTPLFIDNALTHAGMDKETVKNLAAAGLSGVLVISSASKILFGWLFDRFSTSGIALCWALCGIAILFALPVSGVATFLLFTITRGIAQGGVVVENPILARHIFGLKPLSQVMAYLLAAYQLGTAFGTWALGQGFQMTGSYIAPFLGATLLAFGAAALGLTFKPECWPGYKAKAA